MSQLRVHNFSISVDGYGAGPNQNLQNPLKMAGRTEFRFVTDDIHSALEQAKQADCVP